MRVRSSSRFKRVISDAWSAGDGIGEAVDAVALDRTVPPRTAARQFRNIDGEMPNPVATCISGRPLLSNRATASHLNSGENSLLVFGICAPPRPHRLSKVSTESRDHHEAGVAPRRTPWPNPKARHADTRASTVTATNNNGQRRSAKRFAKGIILSARYSRSELVGVCSSCQVGSVRRRNDTATDVWVRSLLEKKPARVATVAMANKAARIAWR